MNNIGSIFGQLWTDINKADTKTFSFISCFQCCFRKILMQVINGLEIYWIYLEFFWTIFGRFGTDKDIVDTKAFSFISAEAAFEAANEALVSCRSCFPWRRSLAPRGTFRLLPQWLFLEIFVQKVFETFLNFRQECMTYQRN